MLKPELLKVANNTFIKVALLVGFLAGVAQLKAQCPNPGYLIVLPDTTLVYKSDSILLHGGYGMLAYQWSTGATTEQIWVKQEGKYKVDVTMNGGVCGSDSTVVLFFDGITGGEQFICLGDSLPLALDQRCSNMQWSTGDTSRQIKIKPDIKEIIFASFLFGSKLFSDTIQARVNPNPSGELLFSKSKLCSNDSIALKAPEGNYRYTWFRNDSLLTDTAAKIIIRYPQQIEVMVTDTNGCKTKSERLVVTLAELPRTKIILLTDSFQCDKDNWFVFKDSTQLADGTYTRYWDFDNGVFSLDSILEYHYSSINQFWVKLVVTTDNNCLALDSQRIVVNPSPYIQDIEGDLIIWNNDRNRDKETHTYIAHPVIIGYLKYNWSLTYGYILTGEGTYEIDVVWADMQHIGNIQLVITDPNGCKDTLKRSVNFLYTGLEDQNIKYGIVLSPNPNYGSFQLKLKNPSNEGFSIAICDLTGKEQWSSRFSDSFFQNDFEVKTHLKPGMYTVHVHQGSEHWVEKMVVE